MREHPLAGCGVLVTRPENQAEELVAAIEAAGGTAIRFPVLEIIGRDPDTVAKEAAAMPAADILLFVSRNAAQYGAQIGPARSAAIGAIGPTTRAMLEIKGHHVSIFPAGDFNSEQLLAHPDLKDVKGKNITLVRGEKGRELLGQVLASRGATVNYLSAYRRRPRRAPAHEILALDELWQNGGVNFVTVMSVESLDNLLQMLSPATVARLRQTPLVAPGARVIQTAIERLPGVPAYEAPGPQTDDILSALQAAQESGTHR